MWRSPGGKGRYLANIILGQKKNGDMGGKIPNRGGGGSDPNPLHIFLFFPIQGLIKWQQNTIKNM